MTHIHRGNYALAAAYLDEVIALADATGALLWKLVGRGGPRLRIGSKRQSRGRGQRDHLRIQRVALNGDDGMATGVLVIFSESLWATRPIRRGFALHY